MEYQHTQLQQSKRNILQSQVTAARRCSLGMHKWALILRKNTFKSQFLQRGTFSSNYFSVI